MEPVRRRARSLSSHDARGGGTESSLSSPNFNGSSLRASVQDWLWGSKGVLYRAESRLHIQHVREARSVLLQRHEASSSSGVGCGYGGEQVSAGDRTRLLGSETPSHAAVAYGISSDNQGVAQQPPQVSYFVVLAVMVVVIVLCITIKREFDVVHQKFHSVRTHLHVRGTRTHCIGVSFCCFVLFCCKS
jgi:hypothetical protein